MTTLPNCTICGAESPYLLSKEGHPLHRCSRCLLVFMHPQPEEAYLAAEVYSAESGYQANKARNLVEVRPARKARRLKAWLDGRAGKKLLDVGCSNGEFLYYMKQGGYEAHGVELNPRTAGIARDNGLEVINGTLEQAAYLDQAFDVAHLGDVIEHVRDPRALVAECARILRSGGLLVVSTPNLDCFWAKATLRLHQLFRIPWSSVTPPHHTYQFSYGNLNLLIERFGFSVERAWFDRPPRLMYELGSLHLLKRYKRSRKLSDALYMLFAFGFYAGLYALDILITPFKRRDFAMTVAYRKHD